MRLGGTFLSLSVGRACALLPTLSLPETLAQAYPLCPPGPRDPLPALRPWDPPPGPRDPHPTPRLQAEVVASSLRSPLMCLCPKCEQNPLTQGKHLVLSASWELTDWIHFPKQQQLLCVIVLCGGWPGIVRTASGLWSSQRTRNSRPNNGHP